MSNHSFQAVYQIWNDQVGSRIEIGPDCDAIGLTEIHYVGSNGTKENPILVNQDELRMLRDAIDRRLEDIDNGN